jgi:hypothetical protein
VTGGNASPGRALICPLKPEETCHVDNALRYHGHRRHPGDGGGKVDGAFVAKNTLVIKAFEDL